MANRRFSKVAQQSLERAVVHLYAKVAIGGTGAPTLDANNSQGFSSIARNSAGDYTVTLQDKYHDFLCAKAVFNSGASPAASPTMSVKADSIASAGTLEVVFCAGVTPTDPASGEILYLHLELRNTSVVR